MIHVYEELWSKKLRALQEQIKICAIVDEQIKNICRSSSKVDQNIAFVFRLRKLLGNKAFANTTRSINLKSLRITRKSKFKTLLRNFC